MAARLMVWFMVGVLAACSAGAEQGGSRPRARDLGLQVGVLPPGRWNAITDVPGVLVGHATLSRGDNLRTGVTAILPHAGNLFLEKVPAAIHVGNGFGKLMGVTQVEELGNLETPILLTGTLNVPRAADALLDYMLQLPEMEDVRSIKCMVVVATDAPLDAHNLKRLAARAMLGLAATGSPSTNGSGDYVIAFSTHAALRVPYRRSAGTVRGRIAARPVLSNDDISPLFQAVKEATEEAVYNSLLAAVTTEGRDGHRVEAIPRDRLVEILKKYRLIDD